jgi:uncharacterized protein YPO0396
MKIQVLSTFLDGTDRFEKDDCRTVDDDRGSRFVANGWANDVDGRVATGSEQTAETTLDIKNAVMGQEVRHG